MKSTTDILAEMQTIIESDIDSPMVKNILIEKLKEAKESLEIGKQALDLAEKALPENKPVVLVVSKVGNQITFPVTTFVTLESNEEVSEIFENMNIDVEIPSEIGTLIETTEILGEGDIPKKEPIRMPFKDAPVGARFKYPNTEHIVVKVNSYPKGMHQDGLGLVVDWHGNTNKPQGHSCFVDDENGITYDTEIELI